jgi:hypothetical protein
MDEQRPLSYLSPKLEGGDNPDKGGFSVVAQEDVTAGDVLAVWGGEVLDGSALDRLPVEVRQHAIQVEEGLYLSPSREACAADYFNHSCEPNAGMCGQIVLVAMRDIAAGEEVCFDYAMTDGTPYDEFECACGSPSCRGRVTGDDWRNPDLWERYKGFFSPYIQRRIDRIRVQMLETA